jgi:uncharacterized protein involved in outer membrane biogenesis
VNALLAAITSLLIVVFAAAFAAPYVVDWNEYRTVFEAQASKLAGRPVRVEGDVDLTILPVPEVRFERVSIADRSGSFETASASARAFRMALSIPPLLRGKIEARQIELDQLSLRLGLDADGQVDWPRIGDAAAGLPFLPADVALKSVRLNDAALEVARPGEAVRWRVSGITGTLSAESLNGPFKFTGRAAVGDEARDMQLSVGRMSADGLMPVKAASRGERVVYRAQGNLRDLSDGPLFVGEVTASAPLAPDAPAQALPQWRAQANGRATLDGVEFSDLELAITRDQRPQTFTGSANLSWGGGLRLEASLDSRWLDLDRLAGAQIDGKTPAEVLLRLPALLGDVPVPARRARITLAVGQINLGTDIIEDVNAVARRGAGGWGVEKLEAVLPGGSALSFEGAFTREDGAAVVAGEVRTSGGNLGRLLRWALPDMVKAGDAAAEAFSFSAQVESGGGAFSLSDISARLGESRFSASMRLVSGDIRSTTVDVKARTLDLRPFLGSGGSQALLGGLLDRGSASGTGLLGWRKWQIDMRADRLILPELTLSDVETALRIDDKAIAVDTLSMRGRDGFEVSGSGRYPRTEDAGAPQMQLRLAARDAAQVANAAGMIPGARDWLAPHMARLRAATPLNLSASLRPSAVEDGVWMRVDGTAGQTGLTADARFYGEGRYHLALRGENPTLRGLARQVTPRLSGWLSLDDATGAARLAADFTGAPGEPLSGTASLESGAWRFAFDGTAQPDTLRLEGDITLDAQQADQALALAGVSAGPEADRPLKLTTAISSSGDLYTVRAIDFQLDGHRVSGEARVDVSGDVPDVEMNLNAEHFDLGSVAALILKRRRADEDTAWPDAPFAFDALRRMTGNLSLAADELVIGPGLSFRDATLMARVADGAVRVPTLMGRLYGGEAAASAALRPARGRMVFEGEMGVTGLDLAQLPHADGAPLASGTADVELRASSEGLSPRGLMTVMSGDGRLSLGPGEIRGLDPQVVARTAQNYLSAEVQPEDTIAQRLAEPLRTSRFAHEGAQTALRIADGALRMPETSIPTARDSEPVKARAQLDLTTLRLTSRWSVGANLDGLALPELRVLFDGRLRDFGALEPRLDADNLEQYLTVSRVERNVERLEELRRARDAAQPPRADRPADPDGDAQPPQSGTAEPEPLAPGLLLESPDPLPGFSTEIEEAPATESAPGPGPGAAQAAERPDPPPAAASNTPGARLDDPQVVEDARREIMREAPRPPRRERDSFFEVFRN